MEVVEAYRVTVSNYSKSRRTWSHKSIYYSTEAAATTYFETVSVSQTRQKGLKKVHLLKSDHGLFLLSEPVTLLQ